MFLMPPYPVIPRFMRGIQTTPWITRINRVMTRCGIPAQAGIYGSPFSRGCQTWLWIFTLLTLITLTGTAFAATSIPFTINMSEAVNVTGTPRIAVTVGGSPTRYATYTSGSGTSTLTFTYTMVAGDIDLDGVTLVSPIDLNGGTLKDLNGNDATLAFTVPNTSNVKVDYPSLGMDFIYDSDGRYSLNGFIYDTLPTFLSAASGSFTRPSIGTYFDSSGVLQTAASGVPRFDYDPANGNAARGLLIEESQTNGIRNNTMVGAVAGTPGTPPTNWSITNGAGLSSQIVGTGTENGISYIDVRFFGTSSSGPTFPGIYFDTSTQFVAAPNAIATTSAYVKLVGGSWTNTTTQLLVMYNATSAGAGLSQFATSVCVPTSSALNTQRCKVTSSSSTFSNASTFYLRPYFQFTVASAGLAIDVTVRIGLPQIEATSFATSVIPTSGSTVTRATDNLTIPTGTWYNQSEGSFYNNISWESSTAVLTYPMFFRVDDNTSNNRWNLFLKRTTSQMGVDAYNAAAGQGSWLVSSSINGSMKVAGAQKSNNSNVAFGGVLQTNDTSWTPPTVTQLKIYGETANKRFKTLKYYPLRTTDTQLQLMSQ